MAVEMLSRVDRQQEDQRQLGDLALHPAHVRTREIVNPYFVQGGMLEAKAVDDEVTKLQLGLERFALHVENPLNYPPEAKEMIGEKLAKADALDTTTPLEKAAARMAQFQGKINYITDFDNTLSDASKPIPSHPDHDPSKGDYLTHLVPLSEYAEEALNSDRTNFTQVFVQYWQRFLRDPHAVAVARVNGQDVPMRDGVNNLFRGLTELGARKTVLSANFSPFVEGGLDNLDPEVADDTELWAITEDSLVASEKHLVIEHLAKQTPEDFTIYVGDGSSDKPAMEAKGVVGVYFALKDSSFAKALEEKGILYLPYETGDDIISQIQQMQAKAQQLQKAA